MHCPETTMSATGVPANLVIANEVAELRERINQLETFTGEKLDTNRAQILASLKDLPTAVKDCLLDSIFINGAHPMNMSDVERLIRENNATLLDSIMAITGRTGVPLPPAAPAADTPESECVWLTFY
jgi:hypothetical protein